MLSVNPDVMMNNMYTITHEKKNSAQWSRWNQR